MSESVGELVMSHCTLYKEILTFYNDAVTPYVASHEMKV
jgi:hypothetical protein